MNNRVSDAGKAPLWIWIAANVVLLVSGAIGQAATLKLFGDTYPFWQLALLSLIPISIGMVSGCIVHCLWEQDRP